MKTKMANSRGSTLFSEGGPPDPISYLRRISESEIGADDEGNSDRRDELRRSDSADDAVFEQWAEKDKDEAKKMKEEERKQHTKMRATRKQRHHLQEAPARERPSSGETWPYRETLSFTRKFNI